LTITDRPSSETLPLFAGSSGFSTFATPFIVSSLATTSSTAAVNFGSPTFSPSLPWTRMVSPDCSGKSAASTI
jgi:hypothetical protein